MAEQTTYLTENCPQITKHMAKAKVIIPSHTTMAHLEAWKNWDSRNKIPKTDPRFPDIPALAIYLQDFKSLAEISLEIGHHLHADFSSDLYQAKFLKFEWLFPLYDLEIATLKVRSLRWASFSVSQTSKVHSSSICREAWGNCLDLRRNRLG